MTTAPTDRQPRPQPGSRHLELATRLLKRGNISPRRGVTADDMTLALARVLMDTPPTSTHGRLINAALTPCPPDAQGPRPPAQKAVKALLRLGQSPTAAAVAGILDDQQRRKDAIAARAERAAANVQADAARATQAVAKHWREHGRGPTWRQLAKQMGWEDRDVEATIRALAAAGWVDTGTEPGSLRPASHP